AKMATKPPTHDDYTVGWICALPKEQVAAIAMLDQRHKTLPKQANDPNNYTLGSIGNHNVVITCLPKGKIGTISAASVVIYMAGTFPSIRFGLMVGIGGGIPPRVRLGDVVVSVPTNEHPGVVQWDIGKAEQGGEFTRIGALNNPPSSLLSAISTLKTENTLNGSKIPMYLEELRNKHPNIVHEYLKSDSLKDVLYKANYPHVREDSRPGHSEPNASDEWEDQEEEKEEDNCRYCDKTQIIKRKPQEMKVHFGIIASGDKVVKDTALRKWITQGLGKDVLCVEMEAAGLMNNFPCIVIRGICDYADSHKNYAWQEHAAAVAAAFAKELLGYVQPSDVEREGRVKDMLPEVIQCLDAIKDNTTQIRSSVNKREDLEVVNWLSNIDYGSHHFDIHRRQHNTSTGQWLLQSEVYKEWHENPSETLFCPGIPGAGKTFITSIVIEDLKRFVQKDTIAIAYLYCNFRRADYQRIENILSSLLQQLVQNLSSLPSDVQNLYQSHQMNRTRPTLNDISKNIHSIVPRYKKVFIVVDALDECPVSDNCRARLLTELFSLRGTPKAEVNIFATSRPIPEVTSRFNSSLTIEIRAREGDIQGYLKTHMTQLRQCVTQNADLQGAIVKTITQAVDGMFLLVILYVDSLMGIDTENGIRTALRRLEATSKSPEAAYNIAYEDAMRRIEGQSERQAQRAKQVLAWITLAKRPLKKLELRHALAVKLGEPELDERDIPYAEDLVSVCAGLVTIDEASNVIRLVHYTTQEYFERTQQQWFPSAPIEILRTCITYLSFPIFIEEHCERKSLRQALRKRFELYPLYNYASHHWGDHAHADPACQEVLQFLQSQRLVGASCEALLLSETGYVDIPERMNGLHLAAIFGLRKAMEELQNKDDLDSKDSYGRTPLLWAANNGKENIVQLLLDTGKVDKDAKDNRHYTPLLAAIKAGHEGTVRLLLDYKADASTKYDGFTSLSWAIHGRHEAVIRVLLANDQVDINVSEKGGQTPLMRAAKYGYETAVQLLLATGKVDINARDEIGWTPLLCASYWGNESIIKQLLATGMVDINAKDDSGRTSFVYAVESKNENLMNRLLATGMVDMSVKDNYGNTMLSYAIDYGDEDIMEQVLA
ncbi:hypothetical protein M426DRAFT_31693, partial [Hypoxylon sp. CI-4A]